MRRRRGRRQTSWCSEGAVAAGSRSSCWEARAMSSFFIRNSPCWWCPPKPDGKISERKKKEEGHASSTLFAELVVAADAASRRVGVDDPDNRGRGAGAIAADRRVTSAPDLVVDDEIPATTARDSRLIPARRGH